MLKQALKLIYHGLFVINDSPQRIALGLGVGAALGMFPGTGPVAALFLATLLRLNRAAAFLGSLLTNTWLSVVTIILSLKLGSLITNIDSKVAQQNIAQAFNNQPNIYSVFSIFKLSLLKVLLPMIIGYLVLSILFGLLVYLVALFILLKSKEILKRTFHRL